MPPRRKGEFFPSPEQNDDNKARTTATSRVSDPQQHQQTSNDRFGTPTKQAHQRDDQHQREENSFAATPFHQPHCTFGTSPRFIPVSIDGFTGVEYVPHHPFPGPGEYNVNKYKNLRDQVEDERRNHQEQVQMDISRRNNPVTPDVSGVLLFVNNNNKHHSTSLTAQNHYSDPNDQSNITSASRQTTIGERLNSPYHRARDTFGTSSRFVPLTIDGFTCNQLTAVPFPGPGEYKVNKYTSLEQQLAAERRNHVEQVKMDRVFKRSASCSVNSSRTEQNASRAVVATAAATSRSKSPFHRASSTFGTCSRFVEMTKDGYTIINSPRINSSNLVNDRQSEIATPRSALASGNICNDNVNINNNDNTPAPTTKQASSSIASPSSQNRVNSKNNNNNDKDNQSMSIATKKRHQQVYLASQNAPSVPVIGTMSSEQRRMYIRSVIDNFRHPAASTSFAVLPASASTCSSPRYPISQQQQQPQQQWQQSREATAFSSNLSSPLTTARAAASGCEPQQPPTQRACYVDGNEEQQEQQHSGIHSLSSSARYCKGPILPNFVADDVPVSSRRREERQQQQQQHQQQRSASTSLLSSPRQQKNLRQEPSRVRSASGVASGLMSFSSSSQPRYVPNGEQNLPCPSTSRFEAHFERNHYVHPRVTSPKYRTQEVSEQPQLLRKRSASAMLDQQQQRVPQGGSGGQRRRSSSSVSASSQNNNNNKMNNRRSTSPTMARAKRFSLASDFDYQSLDAFFVSWLKNAKETGIYQSPYKTN